MNLWVIHQTATGTKKWKLEPRKNPWVLGTSRESSLRINTNSTTPELFGAFEYKDKHWNFTRLTTPDPNNNVQRFIKLNEATEISFADMNIRVVPLKDKANLLGTQLTAESSNKSLLKIVIKELSSFKFQHFFDKETSPFLGSALLACLLLLVFVSLVPKAAPEDTQKNNTNIATIEVKTNFLVKSKAIVQAMKNSIAPKHQQQALASSASIKNSKQVIGAIFSKIQSRSLQKVLKNVSLNATSKNVISGVLSKSLNVFTKTIPDGKQLAATSAGQGTGLGTIGINTVGSDSGSIAGLGQMDHKGVGNAQIALVADESQVQGGLAREVISNYIQTKLGTILYCYERQLSANPSLYGKVAVKFSIKADGFVDHSEISETTLASQSVETCLLSQVNQWKFPKPEGGMRVVVTYPFMFKSIN